MTDRATIITRIAEAWEQTELTQTQFAMLLRDEATMYEVSPEEASHIDRPERLPTDESVNQLAD